MTKFNIRIIRSYDYTTLLVLGCHAYSLTEAHIYGKMLTENLKSEIRDDIEYEVTWVGEDLNVHY